MLNQSFRQVFVTKTPVLLASGTTVDLGISQIGIVDGNTYTAAPAPTYANNKAIQIWQGMPDLSFIPLMGGIPKTNQASKLIKGKLITRFRKKTAHQGQNQKVAIGFDGFDVTKTLTANCGEKRSVFIKLTGNPIDKLYSVQGLIRQYWLDTGCCDDCGTDNCAAVNASQLADQLVDKINNDPRLKFNSFDTPGLLLAKKVLSTAVDTTGALSNTVYTLSVADGGHNAALAFVQVQYPGMVVIRTSRDGIVSTYQMTRLTSAGAPAAFTNAGIVVLPSCATCPAGYTLNPAGFLYVVRRADAGNPAALTAAATAYAIAGPGESIVRTNFDSPNQLSTYVIVSNVANQAAVGTDSIQAFGDVSAKCTITTPTTTAWTAQTPVLWQFPQTLNLTLSDNVCGVSRLTELQDYYAGILINGQPLTITQLADGPVDCVHGYAVTTFSNVVGIDCQVDEIDFGKIPAFGNSEWVPVTAAPGAVVSAGVIIETAFINRITGECTYLYYPYEADTIHIQVSEYNEDYDASPCENRWPITELQNVQYPVGVGAYVRDQEVKSLGYFLKDYSMDPAVREAEGYVYFSDPFAFYDEYTLEYEFTYKVLGWSQTYTDSYQQVVYFPTGTGTAFETAILGYIESLSSPVDVILD